MSAARKIWHDAKAKVKSPKDWEAKAQLKDDFGPNLDNLDKLTSDMASKIKALESDIAKIEQLARQAQTTMSSYKTKLNHELPGGNKLEKHFREALVDGLNQAWGEMERTCVRHLDGPMKYVHSKHDTTVSKLNDVI